MNDDITQMGSIDEQAGLMRMQNLERTDRVDMAQSTPAFQQKEAQQIICPNCGTANDADAMFCASCGEALKAGVCPNCGSPIDSDADVCEVCHHYIRQNVCSFCGADMEEQDAFCPNCGMPRGGVECPVCHTLNEFSFCKQCGSPVTEEARKLYKELSSLPVCAEINKLSADLEKLDNALPYNTVEDVEKEKQNQELRMRVLELLAKDAGEKNPEIQKRESNRMTKEELDSLKEFKLRQLTEMLSKVSIMPQLKPAKARNYAMATKPVGVRVGWKCNYQNVLHSSPCACAKPQLGGKWLVLGKDDKLKDDNS